jgi:hypothetical protein
MNLVSRANKLPFHIIVEHVTTHVGGRREGDRYSEAAGLFLLAFIVPRRT